MGTTYGSSDKTNLRGNPELKILIACEFSGIVRDAFRAQGHDAISCDLLPTERPGPHYQENVLDRLDHNWDLMIAHPPCTYLSNAGIRWFNEERYGDKARERKRLRLQAFDFIMKLADAKIPQIAIENPVGWLNNHWRKPDQIIQPWQFGDPESKRTCLWLKNLHLLQSTKIVKPKIYAYFKRGKKKGQPIYGTQYLHLAEDRGKTRSITFQGIADAMAEQWG